MLHIVTTGEYYPPVVATWKIFTTGTSYLTTGTLCTVVDHRNNAAGHNKMDPRDYNMKKICCRSPQYNAAGDGRACEAAGTQGNGVHGGHVKQVSLEVKTLRD